MEGSAVKHNQGENRRRNIRVDFKTSIVIRTGEQKIKAYGNSRDLSLKGVFAYTDRKLPAGTKCSVTIFLSGDVDDIQLNMAAEVKRVEKNGLGIAFGPMDLDSYTYLRNIMRYNAEDFDEI